jgi:hypothetical protein
MSGSATTLGTNTYGVVVVGNTVEELIAVAKGTLRTGESSCTFCVVVEIIDIAKGRGGGHIING